MFKVRLKYTCKEAWINEDWIWYICKHDDGQDTVIESKHGDVLRVEETVEEILMAIQIRKTRPRLLHSEV